MRKRGFTLIELLIVIVIIGILAVIVVGLVATNSKNRANDARKKSIMREIQTALEQYMVDNDAYPAALADLYTAPNDYLSGAPEVIDADAYTYTPANSNTEYDLSVTMSQSNAKGPNITNGVYTLTEKQ